MKTTISKLPFLATFFCLLFLSTSLYANTSISEPKLSLDHIILFLDNTKENLSRMNAAGFNEAKALYTRHDGQGTKGYYNLFYNSFLEFLYLESKDEALKNIDNFGSNYIDRWRKNKKICGFAIGLQMKPFKVSKTPFKFSKYVTSLKETQNYYIMSLDNKNSSSPMVFISKPEAYHKSINHLSDLMRISDLNIRKDVVRYMSHENGSTHILKTRITVPVKSINSDILSQVDDFEVVIGNTCQIEIFLKKSPPFKKVSFGERGQMNLIF